MSKLSENLELAYNLLTDDKVNSISDYIYPFTNENIKALLAYFDIKGKDCLSVLGSSDQVLDLFLKGAKSVTAFDANPLTEYYFELKKASIKALSFEDFILFLSEYDLHNRSSELLFNEKLFDDVSIYLKGDSYTFWTRLFEKFGSNVSNMFCFQNPASDLVRNISYLNPSNYDYLKQNANKININFINSNIKDLPYKLTKKVDFAYLSNIFEYSYILFDSPDVPDEEKMIHELKSSKALLSELCKYLNENGEIVLNYLYSMDPDIKGSAFYNKEERDKVFPPPKFKILTFKNAKEASQFDSGCIVYKKAS